MLCYFIEIKNRLLLLFFNWLSVTCTCYFYKEILLFIVVFEHFNKNSNLYHLVFTDITEVLSSFIKIITFITVQTLIYYGLFNSFFFILPALYYTEYHFVLKNFRNFTIIWCFSLYITNLYMLPIMTHFFLSFQTTFIKYSFDLRFEAKLVEYLNFYLSLCCLNVYYSSIFCLLFLILNYLNSTKVFVKNYRKLCFYSFLIFSTIMSPPDLYSQTAIWLFTVIVYELLIWITLYKYFIQTLIR